MGVYAGYVQEPWWEKIEVVLFGNILEIAIFNYSPS